MKSREEIMTLPTHQRKKEFKKRRNVRKAEVKSKLKRRLKEEALKKKQ